MDPISLGVTIAAAMELFEAGNLPRMEDSAAGVNPDDPQEEDPYDIY